MNLVSQLSFGLLGVVAAYVVVAVALLSLNVGSRWLWWIKAGTIVVTTLFFVQSYAAVSSLVGWPSRDRLPPHFQLHWAKIVEPDEFTSFPGAIYMWVEQLDANNVPMGTPRNYRLAYSKSLKDQLTKAQDKIKDGKEVAGTAEMAEDRSDEDSRQAEENQERREGDRQVGEGANNFVTELLDVSFQDMPDIVQPEKAPF
ncbi:MAG: hypothetical protein EXQ88_01755 [Alphaproteobacteria bacterium]|nr:hypothetical protein [Alphaproteobacteria bacterium]